MNLRFGYGFSGNQSAGKGTATVGSKRAAKPVAKTGIQRSRLLSKCYEDLKNRMAERQGCTVKDMLVLARVGTPGQGR